MNTKIKIGIISIVFLIAIVIVFTSSNITGNLFLKEENIIKVGVLADLSGDYANALKGAHRGAEIAVKDLRKEGYNIKLIIEDQQSCNTQETIKAVNKLINIDKVDLIIGGTCSSTTLVAAPIAESTKTIMISPSSSAPSISFAGEYIFRTYVSDNLRTEKMSEKLYNLGYKKMAIITDLEIDSAVEGSKSIKDRFTSLGGKVVIEEGITANDNDFKTIITKIKNKDADVVVIAVMGSRLGIIAKQMKEQGLEIQIAHPWETIEDQEVLNLAQDSINGAIYVLPGSPKENEEYLSFKNKYFENYSEDTIPSYSAESYDALMLGIKAINASDGTKEDIKNKLYVVSQDYQGVSGDVSFNEYGDVTKDVLFKQIVDGKFVVYNN
jgi:branched-chain amino acid transport system substrate-binding protein